MHSGNCQALTDETLKPFSNGAIVHSFGPVTERRPCTTKCRCRLRSCVSFVCIQRCPDAAASSHVMSGHAGDSPRVSKAFLARNLVVLVESPHAYTGPNDA